MPEPQTDWKSFVKKKKVWVLFLHYISPITHYKLCISTAVCTTVHAVQACRSSNTISQFIKASVSLMLKLIVKAFQFQHEGKVGSAGGTGAGVHEDMLSYL